MPDVGFRLFGDATSLERAAVRGKAAISGVDRQAKDFNKFTGVLGKAFAGFGVVQVFSSVINKAQELRDELVKNGKVVDDNTAALARYGDTLDNLKRSATELGVKVFGALPKVGEFFGDRLTESGKAIAQIFHGNFTNPNEVAKQEVADANKARAGAEAQDRAQVVTDQIKKMRAAADFAELDIEGKIVATLKEKSQVEANMAKLDKKSDEFQKGRLRSEELEIQWKKLNNDLEEKRTRENEKQVAIEERAAEQRRREESDLVDAGIRVRKEAEEEKRRRADLEKDRDETAGEVERMRDSALDDSRMTLQELANKTAFTSGISSDVANKSGTAREILALDAQREERRQAGDITGAEELKARAKELRAGLAGTIRGADSNPGGEFAAALKTTEDKLQAINDTLGTKFIGQ